jgi:hypothetical protein
MRSLRQDDSPSRIACSSVLVVACGYSKEEACDHSSVWILGRSVSRDGDQTCMDNRCVCRRE